MPATEVIASSVGFKNGKEVFANNGNGGIVINCSTEWVAQQIQAGFVITCVTNSVILQGAKAWDAYIRADQKGWDLVIFELT